MARSGSQLSLNFEPGLAQRFGSLKACVRHRVYASPKLLKTIAADMDLSESELSRKLGDNPEDKRNFTVDDLETYVRTQGDVTPIHYLAEKFAIDPDTKQAFAKAELARLLPEVIALAKEAQGGK
jgi:hypothetical protein